MSSRELVVLGTASQAPTRYRSHNSYALRWDDQLILFDPGEGTQRQAIFGGIAIARATAICVTHFHGDHCLGLPGVIQRRALDVRTASSPGSQANALSPLPVFFPADGAVYLERMRHAAIFHDTSNLELHPISLPGPPHPVGRLGALTLSAARLDHRVTTYGYRIDEPAGRRFVPELLGRHGIAGPDVGRIEHEGALALANGSVVTLEEVTVDRPGRSMAFVMDTRLCDAALELARGVDLLVCESTFLDADRDLADNYLHMTARQAGELAAEAGARRLVLTHFSARYPDQSVFAEEAGRYHDDVIAAADLAVIPVP